MSNIVYLLTLANTINNDWANADVILKIETGGNIYIPRTANYMPDTRITTIGSWVKVHIQLTSENTLQWIIQDAFIIPTT